MEMNWEQLTKGYKENVDRLESLGRMGKSLSIMIKRKEAMGEPVTFAYGLLKQVRENYKIEKQKVDKLNGDKKTPIK